MKQAIISDAFSRAALRSERFRMVGVLSIMGGFIALDLLQMAIHHTYVDTLRYSAYAAFWVFCAACEMPVLWVIRRAERTGRAVGMWVWVVNTIVECLLPTVALLGLTWDKAHVGPYLALVSPTVQVYGLVIILSTLRLTPALCILSGILSAGGYAGVYLFTLQVAPGNANRHLLIPETYAVYILLLLSAGVVAAAVARQIRQHVIAALHEAETRRKLDRMEYDMNVARSIQMGLLPKKPPPVPGYDIAGFSEPADQTGGDYYDWIELRGGRVMFTIADAAGHGIGPALLIAACRAYFRALAHQDDPLEAITAQVDMLVAADVPANRFITAAVALLDPVAHRLALYSAGHAPLYLYLAATDEVVAFDADQPPLGVGQGADGSRARVLDLAPGDALVLVTDGFFECANSAGELLGTERLGEAIRRHQEHGARTLIVNLLEEVKAFSAGVPQGDDRTAVVMRRMPV